MSFLLVAAVHLKLLLGFIETNKLKLQVYYISSCALAVTAGFRVMAFLRTWILTFKQGQSYSLPVFDSYSLPVFDSYSLPVFDSNSIPVFDSYRLPVFDSYSLSVFDSYSLINIVYQY